MQIFYTGAKTYLGEQKESSASLGGLISSTEVPNGLLSNLFGTLSKFTIQQNKPEFRAVVIKNNRRRLCANRQIKKDQQYCTQKFLHKYGSAILFYFTAKIKLWLPSCLK